MKKLSFEIVTRSLRYMEADTEEIAEDKNYKVIIRDDSSKVLSIMKKSYTELLNRDFEKIVHNIIDFSGFELVGFNEFKEGRIVLANLRNTAGDITLFKKRIEDYLIVGSSHDGSYPFFIGTAMMNIWCQNQFSKLTKITKIRHTSTSSKKRSETEIIMNLYFKQRELIYKRFKEFQKVEIPEELRKQVLASVLDISKEKLDEGLKGKKLTQFLKLQECYQKEVEAYGHTAYTIFNATTRYTTHELVSKDKVFGNFAGVPGWINDKAYKIADQLVESTKF